MNPILLTISNSPAAMPSATAAPVERGAFASTLAAAHSLSSASRSMANERAGSSVLEITSAKSATDLGIPLPPAQGPQPKKQVSNSSATASLTLGTSVPVSLPDISQITPPTLVLNTGAQNVDPGGTVQSELPFAVSDSQAFTSTISNTTSKNVLSDFSASADQLSGTLIANQKIGQGNVQENPLPGAVPSAAVPSRVTVISSNNVLSNKDPRSQGKEPASGLKSASPETSPVPSPAWADGLSPKGSAVANVQAELPAASAPVLLGQFVGSVVAATSSPEAFVANQPDTKAGSQEIRNSAATSGLKSTLQTIVDVVSSQAAPILVASNFSNAGQVTGALVSAMSVQTLPGDAANVISPDTAGQVHPSPETANGSPAPANSNAQSSVSDILNLPSSPAVAKALPPAPVPGIAAVTTSPIGRGAGQSTYSPATPPSSTLPSTATNPTKGLPESGQTPFSVFFSAPGPGAESAASALPKMILPATGSGSRDSHTALGGTASPSPQSNGAPGAVPQSASPQNGSESAARNVSGNSPATQAPHHSGDPGATNAPLASAPAAAIPVPAPLTTCAVLSSSGQPAAVTDAQPRLSSPPASPADRPPSLSAPALEPATVVPSPVQVAQLITRVQQSEMRIGMNTSAFGSVEVRTLVHANDVGLVIGSEKGDLRTLLGNDIPVITNTLQQQNLRLNSVNFMQGFAFSNNASGGGNSQPQSFVPMRAAPGLVLPVVPGEESREAPSAAEFDSGRSSLSILA